MALMADRLVVIGKGRLLADTTVAELSGRTPSLEEAFLQITGDSAQYQARNMS
jgi:ABC-2 type transport system ATP-binding protein